MAALAEYTAEQFSRVPGANLFHDTRPIAFDGSRTQPKLSCGFLVGLAEGYPCKNLSFAPGERFAARHIE